MGPQSWSFHLRRRKIHPVIHAARASVPQSLALLAGLFASVTVNAEIGTKNTLDFELSNGRQFIKLSQLPAQTTVINFWRSDCPPCVREMPLLAELAQSGKVRVITVALQRPQETAAAPAAITETLKPPLLSLHGPSEPRGLLARFGNPHGALPHTVLLDPERHPCGQHTGELSSAWLAAATAACSTP